MSLQDIIKLVSIPISLFAVWLVLVFLIVLAPIMFLGINSPPIELRTPVGVIDPSMWAAIDYQLR